MTEPVIATASACLADWLGPITYGDAPDKPERLRRRVLTARLLYERAMRPVPHGVDLRERERARDPELFAHARKFHEENPRS